MFLSPRNIPGNWWIQANIRPIQDKTWLIYTDITDTGQISENHNPSNIDESKSLRILNAGQENRINNYVRKLIVMRFS